MDADDWTVRPAEEKDRWAIRTLVWSEKLNPVGLHWRGFVVAVIGTKVVGAAQLRKHRGGARELGSLVVARPQRGRGIAESLIAALLQRESGAVHLVTARVRTRRFARFGFREVAPTAAPRPVRWNLRIGALAGGALSLLRGRRPVRLTVLERPPKSPP